MSQPARDVTAEKAISSVVEKFLGPGNVRKIVVSALDDYSGDPSLYVNIHLRSADFMPSVEQRLRLGDAVRQELAELEDSRFPYITILGSRWEGDPARERKSA